MYIRKIDKTGKDYIDIDCHVFVENRKISIFNEINNVLAMDIVNQLEYLDSLNNEDIKLYINSPGGSITAGLAIYDTMRYIKSDVSTICVGRAASMGAFLLAAGTKGKRFAHQNSEIMIHQPLIYGGLSGQCTDVKIRADNLVRTKDNINRILAENTGKSIKTIRADTERDNYMTASEALNYGLIDKLLEPKK